jgi:hypothetical protein
MGGLQPAPKVRSLGMAVKGSVDARSRLLETGLASATDRL